MNYYKSIITFILTLLLFVSFTSINCVFDGAIWGLHYYTIGLGLVSVLTVSFLLFFKKGSLRINITAVDALLILLMAYIGIQFLCMPFPEAYLSYYYILTLFVVVIKLFKPVFEGHQRQLLLLSTAFLLVGFLEGGYGILQKMGLAVNHTIDFEVGGTFGNPGPYSNYLVTVLIFAFGFFLYFKPIGFLQSALRHFALAAAIIIAIVLPSTEARTSWLAAIVGLFAVSWPLVKAMPITKLLIGNAKRKAVAISVLVAMMIFSSIILYQYKIQSAKGRLLIYEVSLAMIKEKPVFGHGFCRFTAEYNNYQASYFKNHPDSDKAMLADNVKTGFNEFIQMAIELGLTGLLLFIGFIVLVFRSKPKPEWEYLSLPAKGALLAVFICCLFSYPLHVVPVAVASVFLLAIVMAVNTEKGYTFAISNRVIKPLALLASVTALFICYLEWRDFEARKQWKQAIDYAQVQDYKKALPYYENAYIVLKYDGFFLYNYGSELLNINPMRGTIILEEATNYLSDNDLYVFLGDGYRALKKYEKAEDCYLLSSFMVPCKFYPRYQLFKLYCETNQYFKAQTVAKTIVKMNVKIPSETVSTIKYEVAEWIENQK